MDVMDAAMSDAFCPELAHLKLALYHLEKRKEDSFIFVRQEIRKVIPMLEDEVRQELEKRMR